MLLEFLESREELRLVLEELGLAEAEGDPLSFGDIALRLASLLPQLPWRERIDPQSCDDKPPLAQITETGLYNRGIISIGGRSQYTAGLETELKKLAQLPEEARTGTALQHVLGSPIGCDSRPGRPHDIFEAVPLNDEQRDAVRSAMTAPFTVITGPPGTGKSQVVTAIVVNAALEGQRVLFASKNNKAVDVVCERANGLTNRPLLIRLGNEDEQKQALLHFLARLLSSDAKEADQRELAEADEQYRALLLEREENQRRLDAVIAIRNRVDELDGEIEDSRLHWAPEVFTASLTRRDQVPLDSADQLRARALECVGVIRGFLGGIRWLLCRKRLVPRLNSALAHCTRDADLVGLSLPQPADKSPDLRVYLSAAETLAQRIRTANLISHYGSLLVQLSEAEALPALSLMDAEIRDRLTEAACMYLAAWSQCLPSRLDQDSRRALSRYRAALQCLTGDGLSRQELARLFREIEETFHAISRFLSCWCVTNLSARGRIPYVAGFFDLVVIDEASQCDIASALPLLFRAKRAVIIGDPNQLQHIASISKHQDAELRRKHGLLSFSTLDFGYKENSLFAMSLGFVGKESVVRLLDHHRSHADIVSFSNSHFYEGTLRIATDYRRLKRDNGSWGIRWVDVTGRVAKPGGHGALNEHEAKRVVAEVVSLIRERRYTGTVGVTTPFRHQANHIRDGLFRELSAAEIANAELLVDVVHKFQGDERDCMFFSPVVSQATPDTALGFLRSTGNLFNVAVTRARAVLFVVGDMDACGHSGVEYLEGFVKHCRTSEVAKPSEQRGGEFESPWEKVLYDALVQSGMKPMPQYVFNQYRLDLAIKKEDIWLDVEVDGERYHRAWTGDITRADVIRNQRLAEQGWRVIRFWVYEVRDDLEGCVRRVRDALQCKTGNKLA
ncbi:MAG: AAA domain-containing protein [Planctomycetota bacterium]|nr:AAA domain-containing protein [Planctomycetota bacterium]